MSFNGLTPLWDFNLPPALPDISDDQFLELINQQFPTLPQEPFQKLPTTADPQALSRFPVNFSPLISDDSSPSPPSTSTEQQQQQVSPNGTRSRKHSEHQPRPTRSSERLQDEGHKRKASFDDDEDDEDGQPLHKSFHGDQANSKKSTARRKSSSGANQKDETRLLKRKEQNRAAQRAFRERKEKHVRDLEDRVAQLEAKSEQQNQENENLRDLLNRLQSENRALKDSSFTFSFPSAMQAHQPDDIIGSPQHMLSPVAARSPQTISSAASPSGFDPVLAQPYFNLDALASPPSNAGLSPFSSPPPGGVQSPYIAVASNPLFMSYPDPPFSAFIANSPGSNSQSSNQNSLNAPAQSLRAMSPSGMSDFFQMEGLIPFSGNFDIFGDAAAQSMAASLSPIALSTTSQPTDGQQHTDASCPKNRAEMAAKIAGAGVGTFGPSVEPMSATSFSQPSTSSSFGTTHSSTSSSFTQASTSTSSTSQTPRSESPFSYISNLQTDTPMDETDASTGLPCGAFPTTEPSERHVPLREAWEKVKQHPRYKDCDMDELCVMLTAKAKCDGKQPVVQPSEVHEVLEQISTMAQAAQFRK